MEKRTNVKRVNSEGFGYSVTVALDLLELNPGVRKETIQKHFDFMIALAITDLISPLRDVPAEINLSMIDLKCKTIPDYGRILDAVLSSGVEDRDSEKEAKN